MNEKLLILDDYSVYFQTFGESLQTRVTILSTEFFDDQSEILLVEPGRTILIGDVKEELKRLFTDVGRPTLNDRTATSSRPGGVFSTRAYDSLRAYLFNDSIDSDEPRIRPSKRTKKQPVYRDLETQAA